MIYNHQYKITANKNLGQHYLIDTKVARDIAQLVPPNQERYLEIGPGTGSLTCELIKLFQPLICIELDTKFRPIPGAEWIYADALDYKYQKSDWIASNLPYNISTAILQQLCEAEVAGWTVMVQKEVAERIVAKKGKAYGALSVLIQSMFDVKLHFDVPPTAFDPAPKVMSSVISGSRLSQNCNMQKLSDLTKIVFRHRRKQIRTGIPAEILQILERYNIPSTARPEEIPAATFWEIAKNN